MAESSINGSPEQQHTAELRLVPEQRLLSGGEFKPPSPAFLRAIAADPDEHKQTIETALYALELCGAIDRRADLEGDTRIIRTELQEFFEHYVTTELSDANIAAERQRIQQMLTEVEQAASANELVSQQLRIALEYDMQHTDQQQSEANELIHLYGLEHSPCFEEITAIEAINREGKPIISRTVTAAARRTLEMVVLSDADDKLAIFSVQNQPKHTPEAA